MIVIIELNKIIIHYKKIEGRGNRYERIKMDRTRNDVKGCIGRINADNSVTIVSIEEYLENEEDTEEDTQRFPVQIEEAIRNGTAVAATDAAMIENYIATHWIVTTKDNDVETVGGIRSTKWNNGMISAGEGVGLLGLIKRIVNVIKDIKQG